MREPSDAPRRGSWFRIVFIIVLLVAVVISGAYLSYCHSTYRFIKQRAQAALTIKLETLSAEGVPLTLEDLDKWYTTPPSNENAAVVLQQAFDFYVPPKTSGRPSRWGRSREEEGPEKPLPIIGFAELPPPDEPLSKEMTEAITEVLTKNEATLKLLHTGAQMTACRYPIDLTKSGLVKLVHLNKIRPAVSLLILEALLAVERGNSGFAVNTIIAGFGVARSLRSEPVVISQLLQCSCQIRLAKQLERVLGRSALTREQIAELESTLIQGENPDGLRRAYVGELCRLLSYYQIYTNEYSKPVQFWPTHQQIRDYGSWRALYYVPAQGFQDYRYRTSGVFELDVLVALSLRVAFIRASQLPLPDGLRVGKTITDQEEQYSSGGSSFFIMPASVRALITQARCIAQLRAARGALALERARLIQGRLPEAVDTLLPVDPFTGQPLRFKKQGDGYVVYSVGENGVDDGGDEKKDITCRVFR